jgi:hypothetical protein
VLFSRDDVSNYINANFEPVWESVRPVPIVHIDFGNGTKLTRTLNGNIATYCCAADGQVLDLIPGIYDPEGYKARLTQLRLLANYVDQNGVKDRLIRLREYHKSVVEALARNAGLPRFLNVADFLKHRVEGGVKAMLIKSGPKQTAVTKSNAKDDAAFAYLKEDTKANEEVRRRQVSEMLSGNAVQPGQIVKKLYKDVLHADLDDPYLGLGKTLFSTYPFKDEDAKTRATP